VLLVSLGGWLASGAKVIYGLGCLACRDRLGVEEALRMIFLGLTVAIAALVVGGSVVVDNTGPTRLRLFGETVPGVTEQWHIFLAGAVIAIIFVLGVAIAAFGFRRAMGIRRELRDLREGREESLQTLEMEKRQLQQELEHARRNAATLQSSPNTR
jgi:hypothetical protein